MLYLHEKALFYVTLSICPHDLIYMENIMISDTIRKEIAENAVGSTGAGGAWHEILSRKKLTIGFMGGSVTQGYQNLHVMAQAYPQMLADTLRSEGYEIETLICAEAGMGSMAGNLLADELILEKKPDIVFLEYAINETTLKPSVIAFESLVRKLLLHQNPPAVAFLFLRSANDYSCEGFMGEIAAHYGIPFVSLRKGINPVLERGDLEWNAFADQESHPNPDGHLLLAECLLHFLHVMREQPAAPFSPLPNAWLEAPYENMRFLRPCASCECVRTNSPVLPNPHLYYPEIWMVNAEHGTLEITVKCRILLLFYLVHRLPEFGSCEIEVDGTPMKKPVLHSNSIYGWGNENHVIAVNAAKADIHTVTLKPHEKNFCVLGFGICE